MENDIENFLNDLIVEKGYSINTINSYKRDLFNFLFYIFISKRVSEIY